MYLRRISKIGTSIMSIIHVNYLYLFEIKYRKHLCRTLSEVYYVHFPNMYMVSNGNDNKKIKCYNHRDLINFTKCLIISLCHPHWSYKASKMPYSHNKSYFLK